MQANKYDDLISKLRNAKNHLITLKLDLLTQRDAAAISINQRYCTLLTALPTYIKNHKPQHQDLFILSQVQFNKLNACCTDITNKCHIIQLERPTLTCTGLDKISLPYSKMQTFSVVYDDIRSMHNNKDGSGQAIANESNEQLCQTSPVKFAHSVAKVDKAVEPLIIVLASKSVQKSTDVHDYSCGQEIHMADEFTENQKLLIDSCCSTYKIPVANYQSSTSIKKHDAAISTQKELLDITNSSKNEEDSMKDAPKNILKKDNEESKKNTKKVQFEVTNSQEKNIKNRNRPNKSKLKEILKPKEDSSSEDQPNVFKSKTSQILKSPEQSNEELSNKKEEPKKYPLRNRKKH